MSKPTLQAIIAGTRRGRPGVKAADAIPFLTPPVDHVRVAGHILVRQAVGASPLSLVTPLSERRCG